MPDVPNAAFLPRVSALFSCVISPRIRAILFDAGDTLIAYRRPLRILLQDFFIQHNEILKRDDIAEALEGVNPRHDTLVHQVRTVADEQRMWLELARDLLDILLPRRRDLYPELARWFVDGYRHLKVFRDAGPTLRRLHARAYRLAVVSNWEPSLKVTLDKLGLGKYFDTVVISAAEGVWKPDPRLFGIALDRLGIPAAEALSVGDHIARDVDAARTAGLSAVLLDRFDNHPEYSPRVKSLAELLEFLTGAYPANIAHTGNKGNK